MSSDLSLAIVAPLLGLLTAGVLRLINNWINVRAGVDEDLRTQRLEHYPALWSATEVVSRWPRVALSHHALEDLHRTLRSWYYGSGGLFFSDHARARYGDVQELIAALLAADDGEASDVLATRGYTDLMETASALRTSLTQDLDTRRRKSAWENRRRRRWHAEESRAAKERIARAGPTLDSKIWSKETGREGYFKETAPGSVQA